MIQESRVEVPETEVRRMPTGAAAPYETGPGVLPAALQRLSWGALIAGAVVAMAVQAMFVVLGLAIGLSLAPAVPGEGLAIMAGIWWVITALVALFIGGYIAGRFCYIRHPFHSSMHGVMTWCLVTALSIVMIGWLGGVVAAGPMAGIVDDLVHVQADEREMRVGVEVPERVGVGIDAPEQQPARDAEGDLGATAAAWWTFFALLLGVAAAGLGGYLASPANLRETTGGIGGTMKRGNEPEA